MDTELFTAENLVSVALGTTDILIVAYIVYRVLLLIRGTRAQQALMGLALIGVAFGMSRLAKMQTLTWILDGFLQSFLLIVIVVFQHDIRRGLSRVGRRPFMGFGGYGQGAYLIDELARAASLLAKDRIGAIIIVEREADLIELAETGIRIDSRISTPLLAQIFTPPGPLHDGASLIQQGRISSAAVFLPLTQNPRIDPSLGTRHRAAVGITEEVDAIALVVSEERGQVSVAAGGVLTRDLDEAMLRKVLQNYLATPLAKKKAKDAKS